MPTLTAFAIVCAPGEADVPCPPLGRSPTLWHEDNAHHQMHHLQWVRGLESHAASTKTLVLGVGAEWWQQAHYPSGADGCRSPGGVADAFTPLAPSP